MYKELSTFYNEGRIRIILTPHIMSLKAVSDIIPAVNQFEIIPLNTPKSLISYCQKHEITIEEMSTFIHFGSIEARKEIIENSTLKQIALNTERVQYR